MLIIDLCSDKDFDGFVNDLRTYLAVLHLFTRIGEATKRISFEFRNENPDIPWRYMAGMRDKLVHDYDEISPSDIWRVVSEELPNLRVMLERFDSGS